MTRWCVLADGSLEFSRPWDAAKVPIYPFESSDPCVRPIAGPDPGHEWFGGEYVPPLQKVVLLNHMTQAFPDCVDYQRREVRGVWLWDPVAETWEQIADTNWPGIEDVAHANIAWLPTINRLFIDDDSGRYLCDVTTDVQAWDCEQIRDDLATPAALRSWKYLPGRDQLCHIQSSGSKNFRCFDMAALGGDAVLDVPFPTPANARFYGFDELPAEHGGPGVMFYNGSDTVFFLDASENWREGAAPFEPSDKHDRPTSSWRWWSDYSMFCGFVRGEVRCFKPDVPNMLSLASTITDSPSSNASTSSKSFEYFELLLGLIGSSASPLLMFTISLCLPTESISPSGRIPAPLP